jgi:putative DNA primase/helicase
LFFIEGGMAPDEFRALRLAMRSNALWGDAHNTGAAAIYRLPQGIHSKSTYGGWKVRGDKWTGNTYLPETLWKALAPAGAPRAPGRGSDADLIEDEALLRALVELIPNAVADWDLFVNVGRAIWGASNGTAPDVFADWAAKFSGNDPAVTEARWDSYHDAVIGRFWLIRKARETDPAGVDAWLKKEAAAVFNEPTGLPEIDEVLALQRDVANLIVRTYGGTIRWNVSTSMWHRFDKTWTESPHPLGYRLAKRWADGAAGQLGVQHRAAVSKSAFYEGVEKILRADEHLAVVKTDFDTDDWLLGTPGGTVDLKTGVRRTPKASEMISLSTAVTPADTEDCPAWLKFIDWACTNPATGKVDKGMRTTLKQWAGYCLTGDVTQEMVAFLHGGGSNGKGTYIETLQAALGSYFYLATKDLFMEGKYGTHTEEIAVLAGKRMVAADEVPTNAKWNESLLKAVSGGGVMTTRHLYGRVFSFPIRFKVTIIGNDKPTFQGAINEALKRRLHLVEFLNTAKPRDPAVKAAVILEAPGVLRWMINGLLDLLKEPGGKLFVADSVQDATTEYFNENDLFKQWEVQCVVPTVGGSVTATEALKSWQDFRSAAGNVHMFNGTKEFRAEMERRGYVWKPTNSANVIKDITLRSAVFAF